MTVEIERDAPTSWRHYVSEYRESWSVLTWVWHELMSAESRKGAVVFTLLSAVALLVFTLQPLVLGWLINAVDGRELQFMLVALGILLGLAVLQQCSALVTHLSREWLWNRNMSRRHDRVNELFYEKTLGQHLEEGSHLNYASLEKANARVMHLQEMLMFETMQIALTVLFSYVLMWYLLWEAALVLTGLMVFHAIWSLRLNYHVAAGTTEIEQDFRAENRQLVERWEKIARVKTSGKSFAEQDRLTHWFSDILKRDQRFWFWFIYQSFLRDGVGNIVRFGILCYGVYLVYRGDQEVGFLLPLYTWVTQVVQNLWMFGQVERRVNENIPYIRAMRDALTQPATFSENTGDKIAMDKPIGIRFENVSLQYGNGDACVPTLRNISFRIAPGEKLGLIGHSGAGKSSIMKLLLRFMDPTEGDIWLNGHRLTDVQLTSWMQHVGYIPQEAHIFDGTIRYNLTFGLSPERQRSITDEEIWEVMRLLQIDFGSRLTDGLDTVVGRDGMKLSGGERQRLIAGAAVIKQPVFMVIDEATSSLDSTTVKIVQEGLRQALSGPVGALVVTHQLSTVRNMCDRFMVLRKLEETPRGESQIEAVADSFEELYRISPTFKQLADDQGVAI